MSVSDLSQKAIANLGWTDIRLTAPVFNGDTVYAESEVHHLLPELRRIRPSRSRHPGTPFSPK